MGIASADDMFPRLVSWPLSKRGVSLGELIPTAIAHTVTKIVMLDGTDHPFDEVKASSSALSTVDPFSETDRSRCGEPRRSKKIACASSGGVLLRDRPREVGCSYFCWGTSTTRS